jgi:hypothetical protein
MKFSPQMREAIEGLYRTFAAYALPEFTEPCPCCHSAAEEALLHARPLRDLSWEMLINYVDDALLTWGDERTFKHFLPRILELFLSHSLAETTFYDPEMLFAKFRYGHWRTWPKQEQIAVEAVLHSIWHQVLSEAPNADRYADVESWICSIAQCEEDLTPYLSQWLNDDRLSSSFALSAILLESAVVLPSNNGRNPFWRERDPQYRQLQLWAKSSAVKEKLLAAESRCIDDEMISELAMARSIAAS